MAIPMDGKTQLVGIVGYPVAHTLSPQMHNAAFKHLGLNWRYVPLLVYPENLATAIKGAVALGFRGLNITVPHKVEAIPLMDSVTEATSVVGAVNTVKIDPATGKCEGLNTDMTGFIADLAANKVRVGKTSKVLVLGAGGAARAVAVGLTRMGATVIFISRTKSNGEALAASIRQTWKEANVSAIGYEELSETAPGATLIVNATPVGMYPDSERSPWPQGVRFPAGATLYDTVYRPMETKLMYDSYQAGLQVIGGVGMLVYQGASAFEIWTGMKPPIEVMRQACLQALKGAL
jgi:shikimate dehydrogenase